MQRHHRALKQLQNGIILVILIVENGFKIHTKSVPSPNEV